MLVIESSVYILSTYICMYVNFDDHMPLINNVLKLKELEVIPSLVELGMAY